LVKFLHQFLKLKFRGIFLEFNGRRFKYLMPFKLLNTLNLKAMIPKKNPKANLETRRGMFFLIGLAFSLGWALLAFEWETGVPATRGWGTVNIEAAEDTYLPPVTKPQPPAPPVKQVSFFELVDNFADIPEAPDLLPTEATGDTWIDVSYVLKETPAEKPVEEEVLLFADQMPEFPGGEQALRRFIAAAVRYPLVAQENGVEGTVFLSFVIDEEGQVTQIAVMRGVDPSLDKEAVRVVQNMPRWKPGRQAGRTVKVQYQIPIVFQLQ